MIIRTDAQSQRVRRVKQVFLIYWTTVATLCVVFFCCESQASAKTNKEKSFQIIQTIETNLGQITVKKRAEPEHATSFEPFMLDVAIQKPKEASLAPDDLAGVYGDFYVEYLGDQEQDVDETYGVVTRRWLLYPQKRGKLELPPTPIAITTPSNDSSSDAQSIVALIPQQTFTIAETDAPVKTVDDIALKLDPITQAPIMTLTIVVLMLLLTILAILAFQKVLSRRRLATPESTNLKEPPYDKAVRRLTELKNSRIYLENMPQFYTDVDAILREYLAAIFPVNAQEKTTQEILRLVGHYNEPAVSILPQQASQPQSGEFAPEPSEKEKATIAVNVLREPEIHAHLEYALKQLELIKFAKRATSFNDASHLYNLTCEVVEQSFRLYSNRLEEFRKALVEYALTPNATQTIASSVSTSCEEVANKDRR